MTTLMVRDPLLAAPFRLLDEFFRTSGTGGRVTGFMPALDVHETEDDYLVLVDLPGVKSEDVSIEFNEQLLTISGSRVPAQMGTAQSVERPYGSFVRTLTLPTGVDSEAIAANYTDGVLTLRIPKPAEVKPKRIAISSGTQRQIET